MPDSGGPPNCNPACQKIILDGDLLGAVFSTTGERIGKYHRPLKSKDDIDLAFHEAVNASYEFIALVRHEIGADTATQLYVETPEHMAKVIEDTCEKIEAFGRPIPQADEVIMKLIAAEDLAFKWCRAVLEGMGYTGPWPQCLS